MFSKNVGTADRVLRAVAGLALIALVFVGPQTPWGWIGLILVGTALVGFCPAYRLIGLRTCPVQSREA
jgi:phosphatidylglycerophosphate synthase